MSIVSAIHRLALGLSAEGGRLVEVWVDGVAYDKLSVEALEGRTLYRIDAPRAKRWSEPVPGLKYANGLITYAVDGTKIRIRRAE